MFKLFSTAAVLALCIPSIAAQRFIAGADVSFLRQMETGGVGFCDAGLTRPGLQILKAHGYTWVRLRLMVDPVSLPNNLEYTIASAKDARALGFKFLLDLHYSDDWADPQHQTVPRAWANLSHAELEKQVFLYTRETLQAFTRQGVPPEMVQVGNEITVGMMWPDGRLPAHWDNFAGLLLAGIHGVHSGTRWRHHPAIMIHIDKGGNQAATKSFLDNLAKYRVPYDVLGQSYYPWWQGSLDDLRANLAFVWNTYHKDTIVVETAYDWRTGENLKGKPPLFAETPEGQRDFLAALARVVRDAPAGRVQGIFWWEPMAGGAIAKRALFDDQHNALPAIHVFDAPGTQAKP